MVHQPVDHGGGKSIIDVEDLAPLLEDAIGRDDNRSGLIAGCHDLEHQVRTTFVNRQIKYLGSAKTGFNEPEEKDFFSARQASLRAGLKKFQSLQKQILFGDAG